MKNIQLHLDLNKLVDSLLGRLKGGDAIYKYIGE
jgi:hypothetical protein